MAEMLPTARRQLEAEVSRGLETGSVVAISHRGTSYEVAVGDDGYGRPLTTDTFFPWGCVSKPIGALAFGSAWDDGLVGLDDPVARYLPEFGEAGKENVRLRDLLCHTTGFEDPLRDPDLSSSKDASDDNSSEPIDLASLSWDLIEEFMWGIICSTVLQAHPGTAMVYNPIANWFILDRALAVARGEKPGDPQRALISALDIRATLGGPSLSQSPTRVLVKDATADDIQTARQMMELPIPGTGVWGSAHDLRTVGDLLLAGGSDNTPQVVRESTVEALTTTHWPGPTGGGWTDTEMSYGLGFMTQHYIFGRPCSWRAYGHVGGSYAMLVVDPNVQLVVAAYWNGGQSEKKSVARTYALTRSIYKDLGIEFARR